MFGSRQSEAPANVKPSAYAKACSQVRAEAGTWVHIKPVSKSVIVPSRLLR